MHVLVYTTHDDDYDNDDGHDAAADDYDGTITIVMMMLKIMMDMSLMGICTSSKV